MDRARPHERAAEALEAPARKHERAASIAADNRLQGAASSGTR